MKRLFSFLARQKVYFSRSGVYLSIANFCMLIATSKASYDISISALVLIPVGVLSALVLGYVDYKLLQYYELKHINEKNDVKHKIDNIEKMLKNMMGDD